jgi:uncharacterized protein
MELLQNHVLIAIVAAWWITQVSKPFIYFISDREWEWGLWFSAGGMPSTHSAIVVAATIAIGMQMGFSSPVFALGIAICMIVLYDATGIRRQAGEHARVINIIIDDLAHGHPLKEEHLKELLGHTPRQVVGGVIFGTIISIVVMSLLH